MKIGATMIMLALQAMSFAGAVWLMSAVACLESGDWLAYKAKHGKSYDSQLEDPMRRSIFMRNKQMIEQFNAERSREAGYEMAVNHFADWTESELRQSLGAKLPDNWSRENNTREGELYLARLLGDQSEPVPDSVDWRQVPGRVTSVKDQGKCGSCWAFSTTGLLEGQQLNVTKGKELISLSEQNLVDCVERYGCDGSWPNKALKFVHQEKGIDSEQSYPYKAKDHNGCRSNKTQSIMSTQGPVALPISEQALEETVARYGPVSIVMNCFMELFWYDNGVYRNTDCPSNLDGPYSLHAVLVVGYGTDPKEGDYWLIKNSWNTKWGESGYFRMARNLNNMCGVASLTVLAKYGPVSVDLASREAVSFTSRQVD